jgi:hypothetical protein
MSFDRFILDSLNAACVQRAARDSSLSIKIEGLKNFMFLNTKDSLFCERLY